MTFENDERFSFIEEDGSKWFCKKDDEFKPNKSLFIEERFEQKFGRTLDFKTISNLVSRSLALREWYADQIEDFILEVEVPEYYNDVLEPREYKELSSKVSKYNDNNAKESAELLKLSIEHKKKVAEVKEKYKKLNETLLNNDLVKILTLSSEALPLGLQLKLENYTPSDQEDVRTSALYGRELLVRYKIFLIEKSKAGENISEIIRENSAKF